MDGKHGTQAPGLQGKAPIPDTNTVFRLKPGSNHARLSWLYSVIAYSSLPAALLLAGAIPPPGASPPSVRLHGLGRELPGGLWWPGPGTRGNRAAQGLPGMLRKPSWFSGVVLQLNFEGCGQFNGLCQRPLGSKLAAAPQSSKGLPCHRPPSWTSTCSLIAESIWSHRLLVRTEQRRVVPLAQGTGAAGTGSNRILITFVPSAPGRRLL